MKTLLTFAVLASTTFTFAQTDIIEMRSRGRSLNKYERFDSYRISKSTNDHVNSNFGMAPEPLVQTAVLDSIKALDDNTAIVYTSEYCTYGYYPVESQFIYVDEQGRELNEPKRVYGNPRVGHLWQPGADTVRNHPIFTRRHSLDSIKAVIDRDYNFNLPSDSITFIGFDNGAGFSNRDSVQPVKHERKQKRNGFGWELLFMIVTPIAFLLGMNRLKLASVSED